MHENRRPTIVLWIDDDDARARDAQGALSEFGVAVVRLPTPGADVDLADWHEEFGPRILVVDAGRSLSARSMDVILRAGIPLIEVNSSFSSDDDGMAQFFTLVIRRGEILNAETIRDVAEIAAAETDRKSFLVAAEDLAVASLSVLEEISTDLEAGRFRECTWRLAQFVDRAASDDASWTIIRDARASTSTDARHGVHELTHSASNVATERFLGLELQVLRSLGSAGAKPETVGRVLNAIADVRRFINIGVALETAEFEALPASLRRLASELRDVSAALADRDDARDRRQRLGRAIRLISTGSLSVAGLAVAAANAVAVAVGNTEAMASVPVGLGAIVAATRSDTAAAVD